MPHTASSSSSTSTSSDFILAYSGSASPYPQELEIADGSSSRTSSGSSTGGGGADRPLMSYSVPFGADWQRDLRGSMDHEFNIHSDAEKEEYFVSHSLYAVPHQGVSFITTSGVVKEVRAVFDRDTKKPKIFTIRCPRAYLRLRYAFVQLKQPSSAPSRFLASGSEIIWPNGMIKAGFHHEVHRQAPWSETEGGKTGNFGLESVRF
ncbi:hypothetical protein F4860DRAFT_526441 [Xylaria cubensis]|nr:hypothetical protein F4860DRAFT_526441 [Xylaria cubensis]